MRRRLSRLLTLAMFLVAALAPSISPVFSQSDLQVADRCPRKVGFIQLFDSGVDELLGGLTQFFPVHEFESVLLQRTGDGLDAVVDEMEDIVVDMKSRGITRILVLTSSVETTPFIEGTAGSLGGLHSDERHPGVIFSATTQGTAAVDAARNWYRAGIDFKTFLLLSPLALLPDVADVAPRPQFILATDFSRAVDGQNTAFRERAEAAGYEIVAIDLGWNEDEQAFDHIELLGDAVEAAPPGSKIGMSVSASPGLTRMSALTLQGLDDSRIFDPDNSNVTYLSLNWVPFHGDFANPGSVPVDVFVGVEAQTEVMFDPAGVNRYLIQLGFPDEKDGGLAAFEYDETTYGAFGRVCAKAFAWLATCGARNLDVRYTIDENRQHVTAYVADVSLPAGKTLFDAVSENLRPNPRWIELNHSRRGIRRLEKHGLPTVRFAR